MPTPHPKTETVDEWMKRCIPVVLEDGTAANQDQAVAVCRSMWDDAKKSAPMKIEHKAASLIEFKLATNESKGTFSGYGAVFGNTDSYGDVISRGAFKQSLKEWQDRGKFPPMLLQHGGGLFGGSPDGLLPIGKWTDMAETPKGLQVEGQLFALGTERGQYLMDGLKSGVLDGLSIGFRTREAVNGTKPGEPRRTLTNIDLVEVSVVTFPANEKARVTAVKSLTDDELRDLETAYRDGGLSRSAAVIAASVTKAYLLRDAGVPTIPAGDQRGPADVTLAEVIKAARKVRVGMLGIRRS